MKLLKCLFAGFIILAAVRAIFTGSPFAGLLLGVLGIILLPPVSRALGSKVKFWNFQFLRYGFYALIFILVAVTINRTPIANTNDSIRTAVDSAQDIANKTQSLPSRSEEVKVDNSDFWKAFDPIVKERIYKLIKQRDCEGLQQEFKIAADNMDRIQANGGDGSRNLDLTIFLEDQMQDMKCY